MSDEADGIARKKMAHVIAIGIKPEADESEDKGADEGLKAAMEELGSALEKKDWGAAAEAFESACALASHHEYDGAETESD